MRGACMGVAIAGCVVAAWFWSPAVRAQSLDPLVADPQHYNLELENQWVRVIRERMGPGEKMPLHQHPAPGSVIVFLTDRHNKLTSQDGTVQDLRNRFDARPPRFFSRAVSFASIEGGRVERGCLCKA